MSDVAYYKKRKVGRPSLGENAQDGDMTKPARRRKKRKAIFVQKKRRTSIVGYHTTESPQVCQTKNTHSEISTCISLVTPERKQMQAHIKVLYISTYVSNDKYFVCAH